MPITLLSSGNKFIAMSNPSLHSHRSATSIQEVVASNFESLEVTYIKAESLKISVRYFERGYIHTIAQVIHDVDNSETWYIHDNGSWVEIDPEQAWFWTAEWQEGEKEVDEEYQQGLSKRFDNMDDLIDSLME